MVWMISEPTSPIQAKAAAEKLRARRLAEGEANMQN